LQNFHNGLTAHGGKFPVGLPFSRALPIKTTDEFGAYAWAWCERLGGGDKTCNPPN
jgi:hypothetical protein